MNDETSDDDGLRRPFEVGEIHEAAVEKLVYGGDGLARIGNRAVFIPFAAAGDRLKVRITEAAKSFARAAIVEVVEPSPARRKPPCAHFGECGGCQLQHLNYEAQLEAKSGFVRESLRRLGGIDWSRPIPVRSAAEFGYRSRAELKVVAGADSGPRIGYYRAGTQELCEIEDCPILMPAIGRELKLLLAGNSTIPAGATRIFLTAGDDEVIVAPGTGDNASAESLDALGTAHQTVRGINYGFGVRSFFQGNRLLLDVLVEEALAGSRGGFAVDLYAGVGLFSLQLAGRFDEVCAVEGNRIAAAHGVENAHANSIHNVRHEPISVEAWLKYKAGEYPRPDLVLLDPPRAGAGEKVVSRIVALGSPAITYISCDPATLARDLRLLAAGGYGIESIIALDMFPQTFHVETVVHLKEGPGMK